MDAKFFARVKQDEPWIMHVKDTWYPRQDFLKIEFSRGNDREFFLGRSPVPPTNSAKIWVYARCGEIEKILLVGEQHVGQQVAQAIFETVSTGDSIKRIAVHWLAKDGTQPNLEVIDIIKPTKCGVFVANPNLNLFLGDLIKRHRGEV